MANTIRGAARERWWREALQRFTRSELGVRAFCRREKLVESTFYFWRREIARRDGEIRKPSVPARKTPPPNFVPVHVSDRAAHGTSPDASIGGRAPHEASITLELAGGRRLRMPETIPARRLVEIIVALEAGAVR